MTPEQIGRENAFAFLDQDGDADISMHWFVEFWDNVQDTLREQGMTHPQQRRKALAAFTWTLTERGVRLNPPTT